MKEQLELIKTEGSIQIENCKDLPRLNHMRIKYLGKKGELTQLLRGMGKLSPEERPVIGKLANEVRNYLEGLVEDKEQELVRNQRSINLEKEWIDVTIPGKRLQTGSRHPLNIVLDEIQDIFIGMGFNIADGPEVEYDYYNFEALNIPRNHPARDTQDTFYITENILLRTQTSPVQVRVMEETKPPIKIISPGRVYRSDDVDATHSPVFHQIEGLVVDRGVTMGDLKGALDVFARELYGPETKTRFRPHHFPFTEPSAEMDVSCIVCEGEGCRVCSNTGWLEILGAGMVHPRVLEMCNIDSEVYSGFAFGMGLDRITMLKYGINDLRLFFENDIRFLQQFRR